MHIMLTGSEVPFGRVGLFICTRGDRLVRGGWPLSGGVNETRESDSWELGGVL